MSDLFKSSVPVTRSLEGADLPEEVTSRARTQGDQPEPKPETRAEPDAALCKCLPPPGGETGRNLVVCVDGTANQFSEKNSNVVELYSRLVKSNKQMTYYNSGIGTFVKDSGSWLSYAAWKQSLNHGLDMAIATNFKNKVLSAYQWLSEHYETGDKIFLFGFSRGAYQVRVIAGMIEKVGLLHKGNNEQIPFAYELYTQTTANENRQNNPDLDKPHRLCKRFKLTLSRPDVKVHFVGVWDTVSSIGVLRGTSLPETTTGMKHVCVFRHALALDELRVKFLPEYVNGGDGPGDSPNERVKEVWFAGSHSDIGGGNAPNEDLDRFGPSLRWISYEAIGYGLKMEPNRGQWFPISPTPSMNLVWKVLEYFPIPIPRLSYGDENPNSVVWWPPHCESPRQMKAGQMIHTSVFEEMKKGYIPKAHTYLGTPWDRDNANMQALIVEDPYSDATKFLHRLYNYTAKSKLTEKDIDALYGLTSTEIGCRSITEFPKAADLLLTALRAEVGDLAQHSALHPDAALNLNVGSDIILGLVKALNAFDSAPRHMSSHSPTALKELWSVLEVKYPDRRQTWAKFKTIFGRPLFALIIGIDIYEDKKISNLKGCVADANDLQKFLTRDLSISTDRINILHNGEATRDNIVRGILNLAADDRIAFNDPILIYYAGHATQNKDEVALVLHDTIIGGDQMGILDTEFNDFLTQLAKAKGNNIIVILDTPHASAFSGKGYAYSSSDSYVLLAACSGNGLAKEKDGRGVFTYELTKILRELGTRIDAISYQDVIRRLFLPGQSPSCKGKFDNRVLFEMRTRKRRPMFPIIRANQSFILQAGSVHGITVGAHFNVYNADDDNAKPIGSLVAHAVAEFSTHLNFEDTTAAFTIPEAELAYGLQIHAGQGTGVTFTISKGLPDAISECIQKKQPVRSTIQIVEKDESPDAALSMVGSDRIAFDITDETCNKAGFRRLPYSLPRDIESISVALSKAADFFWDLRHSNQGSTIGSKLADRVTLEAHFLTKSEPGSDGRRLSSLIPTGRNLNEDSRIAISMEDGVEFQKTLALTLRNAFSVPFYVWLFSFNMLDLTIENIYKPAFSKGPEYDPCLPGKGQLQVGYALSGINLLPGMEVSVTYLKAFLTNEYVDLSHFEQSSSPFDKGFEERLGNAMQDNSYATVSTSPSSQSGESMPLRLRGGATAPVRRAVPRVWGTLLIPIVIRRARSS